MSNRKINNLLHELSHLNYDVDQFIHSERFNKTSGSKRDSLRVINTCLFKMSNADVANISSVYVLIGPPGSGKGIIASQLSEYLNIPHISTGQLLRNCDDEKIKNLLKQGKFAPDEDIISLLEKRIAQEDCDFGYILDGFPRNTNQIKTLSEITNNNFVIVEVVGSDEDIVNRLINRRICSKCGKTYNLISMPPKNKNNKCDACGADLIQRTDDNEKVIKDRLNTYKKETLPVINQLDKICKKHIKISGFLTITKINQELKKEV